MNNLEENAIWEDEVYLIQRNDPVGGGPNGPANKPHIALANRTLYLKEKVDDLAEDLTRVLSSTKDNPAFQANNERIENVQDPKNKQDAATKIYVDTGDEVLQKQLSQLQEKVNFGYELIGDFATGCTVNLRNEIVYDDISKKYYCYVGELPHEVVAGTNVSDEINQGQPWIVIENSNELVGKVESIKQMTETQSPRFYGFKKTGAKLLLDIGGKENNETMIASIFDEWFIAPGGCHFSIKNNKLLLNI